MEPFTLRLGTSKIIVLTSIQDVAAAWKDTASLTFQPWVQKLLNTLGMSKAAQEIIFKDEPAAFVQCEPRSNSLLITDNPSDACFYHNMMRWVARQLSGKNLTDFGGTFISYVSPRLTMSAFSPSVVHATGPTYVDVSLKKWIQSSLVQPATRAFFGEKMLALDPDFVTPYSSFEDCAWKMFYGYPRFLAQDLHSPASRLFSTMTRFFNIPASERKDMAPAFQTIEAEMRNLGLQSRDIAIMSFLLFWGSNANAHVIAFWVLGHILLSPSLTQRVRAETSLAILPNNTINLANLTSKSPLLESIWHECLRLYTVVALIRIAIRPTCISGKTVHTGDQLMAPFRHYHLHEQLFGPDSLTFNPERFLSNKELAKKRGYYPFGGGQTYCPGRHLAKQEVFGMVALVLDRFEMEVLDEEGGKGRMPGVDVKEPSLGAMRPVGDLRVRIRERKRK